MQSPQASGIDLDFRPNSYFWPTGLETHLLSRVKGAERKAALKRLLDRGSLEEILQMVDRTTQAIRQITLATQQQRSASEQIVQTMREVAEVTKESAVGMKQSATSVAELSQLADQFKTRIREFRF